MAKPIVKHVAPATKEPFFVVADKQTEPDHIFVVGRFQPPTKAKVFTVNVKNYYDEVKYYKHFNAALAAGRSELMAKLIAHRKAWGAAVAAAREVANDHRNMLNKP